MGVLIHLFEDEKFVDSTIEQFEAVTPGKNRYLVFSDHEPLNHPKRVDKIEILPNRFGALNLPSIYQDCDLIIVHYMTPIKAYVVKNKPADIQVLWSVWGKDAYDHFSDFEQFLPKTRKLVKWDYRNLLKRSPIYQVYHQFKYGVKSIDKEKEVLEKIDFLSTVLPTEYKLICSEFGLQAKYVQFNYDSLGNTLQEKTNTSLGDRVLLGNSATPTNNHLDVFPFLKDRGHLLVVPLNYGDRLYASKIVEAGRNCFGNNFLPILEYMDFRAYKGLVSDCNSMIMYHLRQQGLGNILLALYLGLRVFLHPFGAVYQYMKNIGMEVFDPDRDRELIGVELLNEQKIKNRGLVNKYWGQAQIYQGTTNIVDLVRSE